MKITFYNKDNNGSLSYDYLFRILFNLGGSSISDILPRRSAFFDAFTIFHDIEYMIEQRIGRSTSLMICMPMLLMANHM